MRRTINSSKQIFFVKRGSVCDRNYDDIFICIVSTKSEPFSCGRRVRIFRSLRGVESGGCFWPVAVPKGRAGQAVPGCLEGKKKDAPRKARLV